MYEKKILGFNKNFRTKLAFPPQQKTDTTAQLYCTLSDELLRPQPLTTHGDRRRRGRRVSLVLRVSTYLPTPPHDSWRSREAEKQNGRWTERPERSPGEQCKIMTMHHPTINQRNQKKGRQKECNLPPRKLTPQKVP